MSWWVNYAHPAMEDQKKFGVRRWIHQLQPSSSSTVLFGFISCSIIANDIGYRWLGWNISNVNELSIEVKCLKAHNKKIGIYKVKRAFQPYHYFMFARTNYLPKILYWGNAHEPHHTLHASQVREVRLFHSSHVRLLRWQLIFRSGLNVMRFTDPSSILDRYLVLAWCADIFKYFLPDFAYSWKSRVSFPQAFSSWIVPLQRQIETETPNDAH